ncbi:MAG: hypothetical protein ACRDYD_05925, partial [Acidimicrobiales bacterium]
VAFHCPHGPGSGSTWHAVGLNWERTAYERAVEGAFGRVRARIRDQAVEAAGHGVVGLRTSLRWLSAQKGVLELAAVGTALRRGGADLLPEPFVSHLSGQELAKLLAAGWVPVSLAAGAGSIEASGGCGAFKGLSRRASWDVPQYGDAIDRARRIAVEHLSRDAAGRGDRVVGVTARVSFSDVPGSESRRADVLLVGTVVRQFRRGSGGVDPLVIMRLP